MPSPQMRAYGAPFHRRGAGDAEEIFIFDRSNFQSLEKISPRPPRLRGKKGRRRRPHLTEE